MIRCVTYPAKFRAFDAGFSLVFRPGINALVGDQGCGKSTILDTLNGVLKGNVERDEGTKVKHFCFEKFNPRISTGFGGVVDFNVQVNAIFQSHGQANVRMLADICKNGVTVPHTFILDEPDTGLSIRSSLVVGNFFKMLAEAGHQVIAAVHSFPLIISLGEVYSVEHKRWMTSKAFVDTQYSPPST